MSRSLFGFRPRTDGPVHLEGNRLYLRIPEFTDFDQWRRLRSDSRRFLEPWEPSWAPDDLTKPAFRARVRSYHGEYVRGHSLPLFLFLREDGNLVGGLTLGNIRRGAAQCAMIGYWMGEAHSGKGYMREALDLVIPHAFNVMRLHRIEAACIPDNERSIALLEKAGFQREGCLRGYLKINGAWRDHLLFARIADKPQPLPAKATPAEMGGKTEAV